MEFRGPKDGSCVWERHSAPKGLEELHQILNCASSRGCNQCVRCSEVALEQMLGHTRANPGSAASLL